MSTQVLVVAEHDGNGLAASTAKTVRCATALDGAEIAVAVFVDDGERGQGIAAGAAGLEGVDRVLVLSDAAYARPLAAVLAPPIAELAADYTHVFGPSSTFGKDLMPRVAGLLGVAQISDVIEAVSADRFRRPIYAGNAVATVEISTRPVIATIRVSSFAEAAHSASAAPIETIQTAATADASSRFVSLSGDQGDRPDLQSARRIVTGGRGMGSAEGFERVGALADTIGAAVGATRAAVDSGFAPNELQVGQTGKVVAPELYIALGVSGAIQHLAGIKDAGTVVAINKDGEAPIFEFADIGLVADVDTALPELQALLEEAGKG